MGNIKKGSKFAAMALAFGVLASTAFQGSNYLYNKANGGTVTATDKAELNIAKRGQQQLHRCCRYRYGQ